jgi:hypothetical protein
VPSHVVIHLTRPYANADEYLSREAWSIDTRSMVLVEQTELPTETDIVFDVTLGDGSKPIRAEARVVGLVAPADGRPGGLRVRFKRYGAATRAFVERAVSLRWSEGEAQGEAPAAQPARGSVRPPPSVPPPPGSLRPPTSVRPGPSETPPPSARIAHIPPWEEDKTSRFSRAIALAAPMTHKATEVAAPKNRDALLDRLRKRSRESGGSGS